MATDNKYDRQLRLWGARGQKALMEARLLMLGAGATGTETLKNLVLPGVGHFTLVDSRNVTEAECKDNFFVTTEHVGQPLAKVATELLVEMNPDVTGEYVVEDVTETVSKAEFISKFSLVIATQLAEADALRLEECCRGAGVPLVLARTYGLMGSVRLSAGDHLVVESKPDNVRPDWRLAKPFKSMAAFADEFKLEELDSHHHGHVPYPVLLLHLRQQWEDAGNAPPKTFREKKAFQAFIASKAPTDYLNYEEASEFAYVVCNKTEIPAEVKEVLAAARAKTLDKGSNRFWFVARAMADFVDNEGDGLLPVCADLADLTSTTKWYIELQRIYSEKAAEDCATIKKRVAALLSDAGAASDLVSDEFVELFCKNARFVRAVKYRCLAEEVAPETWNQEDISDTVLYGGEGEMCPLLWYLMVRSADKFRAKYGDFPGMDEDALDGDATKLATIATALATDLSLPDGTLTAKHAQEICRYAACEPHNVAAIVGGVASQEIVKLVTHQYVPLDNTYFYNGITSRGGQYKL